MQFALWQEFNLNAKQQIYERLQSAVKLLLKKNTNFKQFSWGSLSKVCFVLFQINKHTELCRPSSPIFSLESQCDTVIQLSYILPKLDTKRNKKQQETSIFQQDYQGRRNSQKQSCVQTQKINHLKVGTHLKTTSDLKLTFKVSNLTDFPV